MQKQDEAKPPEKLKFRDVQGERVASFCTAAAVILPKGAGTETRFANDRQWSLGKDLKMTLSRELGGILVQYVHEQQTKKEAYAVLVPLANVLMAELA